MEWQGVRSGLGSCQFISAGGKNLFLLPIINHALLLPAFFRFHLSIAVPAKLLNIRSGFNQYIDSTNYILHSTTYDIVVDCGNMIRVFLVSVSLRVPFHSQSQRQN